MPSSRNLPGVSARLRLGGLGGALIGMARVVFAAVATAFFFVAKLPLLTASGVHPFGLMHLIYVDLVVGDPPSSAWPCWPRRGSPPPEDTGR